MSDALAQCAAISSDATRLSCYDRLARGAVQSEATNTEDAVVDRQPRETRPRETQRRPAVVAAEETAAVTRQSELPADSAAAEPDTTAPAGATEQRRGFFGRQRDRESEDSVESVTVVEVRTNLSDLKTFITDDSRVYTQTSVDNVSHGQPPFNARIEQASMGSFFLIPEGSRRRVRVSLQE